MFSSESLEALAKLREAVPALQEEWRDGSDVTSWRRVKLDADGSDVAELCVSGAWGPKACWLAAGCSCCTECRCAL